MNKIDFILLFDVADANPNGDPDAGNFPRTDAETSHGLITDVCLKRKIRNYVQLTRSDIPGYEIYVKEKAILTNQQKRAYDSVGKAGTEESAKSWMCRNFYDVRTFGAVMSLKEANCGQVRGPVQLSFARSIDPITQQEFTVTRCAVATEKEAKAQKGDNRTMGRKFTVPYALYMAKGTINPFLAEQTGFSDADLDVLVEALTHLFEFDASAARPAGSMSVRKLILFRHDSMLGNAPSHKLYESLFVTKKSGIDFPRSISDYEIKLDKIQIPDGVKADCIDC